MIDKEKFKKTIILIFVCMLITGCNKGIKEGESIAFDVNKIASPCLFSTTFEEVEYLPLETKDESLLGIIQKLRFSNDRYYFLTGFSMEKVIAFDKNNGKHILTIDRNGSGPGEYLRARDISVDRNDSNIVIYSAGTHKFLIYDKQGEFIEGIKTPYFVGNFIKVNDDYYFDAEKDVSYKELYIMRGENKSVEKLFSVEDYSIGDLNNFSHFGNTVSYGSSIFDQILHFKNADLVEKIDYDFNEFKLTERLLKIYNTNMELFYSEKKKGEYAYNMFGTFESSNYIVSIINFNGDYHVLIYSKKSKRIKIFHDAIIDLNGFNKKIEIARNFFPYALDGDVLIFALQASDFKDMLSKSSVEGTLSETPNYDIKQIKSEDNPVLMKCKIKRF